MHNLFLLLGTIIGAGIFSLPIAFTKSGAFIFIVFTTVLAFLMAKINWFYRQVVEHTHERHQLPGYVHKILGNHYSLAAVILLLFSTFGALLAYLILAGQFISQISPLSATQGSWLFYSVMFIFLYFGGRNLEALDVFMTIVKVTLLLIVIFFTFSLRAFAAGLVFQPAALNLKNILLAYGSVLFALTGFSIVPELRKVSPKGETLTLKSSINLAQLISAGLYLIFALNLYRYVQGGNYALSGGLTNALFNLAGIFGVLTPYLMLSWVCYDLFDKDLGFPKKEALLMTIVIPLLLYLVGLHDFLGVISVSGGVFLGGIAIIIVRMYAKKFPGKHVWLIRVIQVVFSFGVLAELASLI